MTSKKPAVRPAQSTPKLTSALTSPPISQPSSATEAFVWAWLPGSSEPVVTGRLAAHGDKLPAQEAMNIAEQQIAVIEQHWKQLCDEAKLTQVDRNLLWRRAFLNPFSIAT